MTLAVALEVLALAARLAVVTGAVYVVGRGFVEVYLGFVVEPYSQWRRSR